MVAVDDRLDLLYLSEIQLSCQHDHVGKLGIESQGLGVGYAELCGYMHLHAYLTGIHDGSHVGSDHGSHPGSLCRFKCAFHILDILVVQDNVQGEICLDPMLRAYAHDLSEVRHLEVVGRVRTHVQFLDSEIYGVRSTLYRCLQALEIARRRHDLQ